MFNLKDKVIITLVASIIWLLLFIKPLSGSVYTSWDTHDIGFVNFLYFSDSLRDGYLPLWNHFIQSGVFFPTLNNIGLFTPFGLIFVLLSWVISPVYAYELMIQASVLLGGIGSYLLFNKFTHNKFISLFGAVTFLTAVLFPIVGQLAFVFSLGSIPWLALACIHIIKGYGAKDKYYFILASLMGFYLASGYPWMNLINLSIVIIFPSIFLVCKYSRIDADGKGIVMLRLRDLLFFFGVVAFVYGCLILPGYINMHSNYSAFYGDYRSPEPRLRSMLWSGMSTYSSVYKAIVATIDPRIVINNEIWIKDLYLWTWGCGWVIVIICLGIFSRKLITLQIILFGLCICSILYSASGGTIIEKAITRVPLLNANRWGVLGVFYAIIGLIFLAIPRLMTLREKSMEQQPKYSYDLQLIIAGLSAASLLYYFKSTILQFILILLIVCLLLLLVRIKNVTFWNVLLCVLMFVHVFSIVAIPYEVESIQANSQNYSVANNYSEDVSGRIKNVVIENNKRKLGKQYHYTYNDENWVIKKEPFTHGYNNLGNPFFWYVKNDPFLERIVTLTQDIRQDDSVERKNFVTDNEFAQSLMGDILTYMNIPTVDANHFTGLVKRPDFSWEIDALEIEPNNAKMKINSNAAAYLVFNNVDYSGWHAYIDGKSVDIIQINRIFQGVFLPTAGTYEVVFKFRPIFTIALMMLPYLILFLGLFRIFGKRYGRVYL